MCQYCGKSPHRKNKKSCEACGIKRSNWQKAVNRRPHNIARQKNWRDARIAAGMCQDCGAAKEDGKTRCQACLKKACSASIKSQNKKTADGLCVKCGMPARPNETCCEQCAIKNKKRTKTRYHKLRMAAIEAYGGYRCKCCGEIEQAFLSIDHINGGGTQHRKQVGKGAAFYRWLEKNSYPPEFQVLCMNCQFGRRICGVCPHQRNRSLT